MLILLLLTSHTYANTLFENVEKVGFSKIEFKEL